MHQSSFSIITRFRDLVDRTFPQGGIKILDVGSYGVNGTYKEIFSNSGKYLYTGLDVNPGPNVDYVPSDPYCWQELQDEAFDVIVSGQAFEHIEYPWLIIEEMNRVLKKNGLICIVAPSRGPEHKYPVDCWRYYPDGFRALAKWVGLKVLDAKTAWGKSGFTDGSDQWGDTFCILFKPESRNNAARRPARKIKPSSATNFNNPLKQNKQSSYYGFARPEVVQAIKKNKLPSEHILELGCAGGATGKSLKESLPVKSYIGIEISPEAAEIAREHLDRVIVANVETSDLAREHGLQYEQFDLLLALDVLEHLYDPWDTLAELSRFVKDGGHVVVSLPNVQNIMIVQDLIGGKWQYQDAGILDATHLRFFTLEEAKKMLSGAGLSIQGIEQVINPSLDMTKVKASGNIYRQGKLAVSDLSKNEMLHLFTYQYVIIARKDSPVATAKMSLPHTAPEVQIPGHNQLLPRLKQDEMLPGVTSIIILTFNQLEYTKKCIKSLGRYTPEHHEIIFVDNGSTDGTQKWLKALVQENKNYTLIENKQNLGFARGCNQGIEASRGEFILLLNSDVVVAQAWLSGLLDCLKHAPEAGIVGPMTNNISGIQQTNDDAYRSVDVLEKYAAKFREQHRHRRIPLRRIVGFCMLFKRSLAEQIGGLDESFGTGNFEDDDFCLRAVLAGHKNYIAGDVFIHHFGSRSFIGNRIDYSATMSGNRKIIDKKWTLSTQSPDGKRLALLKATELADTLYQQGKTDKAIEVLIDCIKITPDAADIYDGLARMFIENKRFSEAWEVIETMPGEVRDSLKGLECAGYAKEGLGLDDEAAVYVDRMLALHDKYSPALNLRGILAYKKEDRHKAEELFLQAIAADPGYGEAWTNLGVLKWSTEKNEDAVEDLKKGVMLAPLVPDHSTLYYSAVSSTDRFAEAEAVFRDVRRIYPNSKTLAYLLIDALVQQGKWEAAIFEIEDALIAFGLDDGILNAALSVREKIGPLQIEKTQKKNTLSLCMIVKNEEQHLAKCLKSVRDIVDEMIVVDTGSTDRTMDIARVFGAQVFEFAWTGDFSEARNVSLSKAAGEWILILDADEVLSPLDFRGLNEIIRKKASSPAAYSITTRNYSKNVSVIGWMQNNGQYAEEAGAGWVASAKVRLFTRRKDVYFSNPVHELLEDSIRKANIPVRACNIVVHHYGKLEDRKDLQKGEDYYLLGKMKYESDPTNVKYINELAKQAQVLDKYEEAVELWLKLITLLKADAGSLGYREMARVSRGEPVSEIYIQLASAYLMLDRYEEALAASRKAMEAKIKIKEYVHIYAHCEIIVGSLNNAFGTLEELLQKTPDYPPALFLMAVIYCLEMKGEKAQEIFQSLLQQGVQVTPVINKIAKQLHGHGKRDEALRILNATVENRIGDEETQSLRDALLMDS